MPPTTRKRASKPRDARIEFRVPRELKQLIEDAADLQGVSETQVSRDERNEYHNVTTERAQRTLCALGANFVMAIEALEPQEERVG